MIHWNCPHCREPLEAPDSVGNERQICPKCRQRSNRDDMLTAAAASSAAPAAVMAAPQPSAKARSARHTLVVGILSLVASVPLYFAFRAWMLAAQSAPAGDTSRNIALAVGLTLAFFLLLGVVCLISGTIRWLLA